MSEGHVWSEATLVAKSPKTQKIGKNNKAKSGAYRPKNHHFGKPGKSQTELGADQLSDSQARRGWPGFAHARLTRSVAGLSHQLRGRVGHEC